MGVRPALICRSCGHRFFGKQGNLDGVRLQAGFKNQILIETGEICAICSGKTKVANGDYLETITPLTTEKTTGDTSDSHNLIKFQSELRDFAKDITNFLVRYKGPASNILVLQYAMSEAKRRKESIEEVTERIRKISPDFKELNERINKFGNDTSGWSNIIQTTCAIAGLIVTVAGLVLTNQNLPNTKNKEEKQIESIIEKLEQNGILQPQQKEELSPSPPEKDPFIIEPKIQNPPGKLEST